MAYVYKVNGTVEKLADTDIGTLQYHVGGWVEHIKLLDGRDGWINEDGLRLGLEFNAEASLLAGRSIVGYMVVSEVGEVK
jgi:hypothetical protein